MKLPIKFDTIMLPCEDLDYTKWAVVACDQFTSQKEYWERLQTEVGDAPSTLSMILPEVYLASDNSQRISSIIATMKDYLDRDLMYNMDEGAIIVERKTPFSSRRGLMLAVDLESYSFAPADKALIRATEGTVLDRIPPRVKIRENCSLETPHIMVLIDDKDNSLIEPLFGMEKELLYDFDLSMGGGHLTGYRTDKLDYITKKLTALLEKSKTSYNDSLLFAVGDGNHSLATAKACWDKIKAKAKADAPARYALVEVVNLYDEGLQFEPIHRLVKVSDKAQFVSGLKKAVAGDTLSAMFVGAEKMPINLPQSAIDGVKAVSDYIDTYIAKFGGAVDYIHGEKDLQEICASTGDIGILLSPMRKEELFPYIVNSGVLPRKTFSMGEAVEKRYYMECRKIK